MNETIKTLLTRRSCRKYTDQKIPEEILDEILKAGTYAPTGRNRQAPVIVAVRNPETVKALSHLNARGWSDGDPFYGANTVLIVLSDPTISTHLHDGALVMGNLMNAAASLGVDSCYIFRAKEMFESPEGKDFLKQWGVPEHYVGIGNCILGYAAEGGKREAGPRKEGYIIKVD